MSPSTSFSQSVRAELAGIDPDKACDRRAELAALVRLGGRIHLRFDGDGDPLRLEIDTSSGAVARRAYRLLDDLHGVRAELHVREPGGVRRSTTYEVHVDSGGREVAVEAGLLGPDGMPQQGLDPDRVRRECDARAYARGALLAAGSFSRPGRPPHLEVAVPTHDLADGLAEVLVRLSGGRATVGHGKAGHRVVIKSGEAIGSLLAQVGATQSFLAWDDHRLRRELRADATRLANADAANLRRTVAAASTQVREVTRALDVLDVDKLDRDLLAVGLARVANPSASLAELGQLCDPPVGKSTVHRRLERLRQLAIEAEARG